MASLQVLRKDSIIQEAEALQQRIAARAYELFEGRNGFGGDPLADWLTAEQELVWKPAIEVTEQGDHVTVLAALPGIDAKDVEVDVTPQDVVIKAGTEHRHSEEKGHVLSCEFVSGQVFRSISLPKPIEVSKVSAELADGLLRVTAPFAAATPPASIPVTVA